MDHLWLAQRPIEQDNLVYHGVARSFQRESVRLVRPKAPDAELGFTHRRNRGGSCLWLYCVEY